MPNSTAP